MQHRGHRSNHPGANLRDDEGNVLPSAPARAPQAFPRIDLPPAPEPNAVDRELLLRKNRLEAAYARAPYFLPLPQDKKGAPG